MRVEELYFPGQIMTSKLFQASWKINKLFTFSLKLILEKERKNIWLKITKIEQYNNFFFFVSEIRTPDFAYIMHYSYQLS